MPPRIGLIGGTGLYELASTEPIHVETPYGDVTVFYTKLGGRQTFFLPRHGAGHERAPHRINHRAHVEALRASHCDYILGVNNVGSLDKTLRPGSWAVVDDFVNFHRGAPATFFEDVAFHADFSRPYCPTASEALARATPTPAQRVIYAGVDGPRFETPAEVQMLAQAGAHVVGMTGVPEATLAHERGLCYACLGFVGNVATGLHGPLAARSIQAKLLSTRGALLKILGAAVRRLPPKKTCRCATAGKRADLALAGAA